MLSRGRSGYHFPVTCLVFYLALSASAAVEGPSARQAASADSAGRLAAASAGPEGASAWARTAFAETASAPVALKNARFAAAPAAKAGPTPVYAAAGAPPAPLGAKVYADDDDGPAFPPFGKGWDRSGTLTAGAVGLAFAAVGFMLGGPIGAAAGFLIGFFIGAAGWKAFG